MPRSPAPAATALPIDPLIPEIRATLERSNRLVLVAPPGAGKTTGVPLALLSAPWLAGGKLVVLEPRRLAARAAARRMASQLGQRVGEEVGYRVHLDTVVGKNTRIEVVTEGVLTRMLQSDPTLPGVGAVLFDEFHERSLHADLGLALALNTQRLIRGDLRIVVMSATLDSTRIGRVLDAPVLQSKGRTHPVETVYRPRGERERVDAAVSRVAREVVSGQSGDVLCFLPGGAEIRRATEALAQTIEDPSVDIRPLYGELTAELQDAAIAPSPRGRRKIVIATNIAETSLTIEGVRIVIDGGLARTPRFSPRTGLTRLETVRISLASADQRRGRAGRTAPGICYRLWSKDDDAQLAPRNVPEILEADLAPLALELAAAGIMDPAELVWLDPPPDGALAQGRELLRQLGALESQTTGARPRASRRSVVSGLTEHGKQLSSLPTHPRIAHMLVRGAEVGQAALACELAALLSNRDVLRPLDHASPVDADIRARVDLIYGDRAPARARVDRDGLRRVREEAQVWRERMEIGEGTKPDLDAIGVLLSFAYPDRIAHRRDTHGRFLLANGTGAHFAEAQPLGSEEWIVIAESDGRSPEARIFSAAAVDFDELRAHHEGMFSTNDEVEWHEETQRVIATRVTRLGEIEVKRQALREPASDLVQGALAGALRRRGIDALPWSDNARTLRQRIAFLRSLDTTWPDMSDAALLESMHEWLTPVLGDTRSLTDIARADLTEALLNRLDWKQRTRLESLAPETIEAPSGSRITIDYSDPAAPALKVRLQELYGLASTPTICQGRVPLTLHLLSPAHRPVQVTRDLAAFWKGSYAEVRKEMRGRYPKHDWPEEPATAKPSRGKKR